MIGGIKIKVLVIGGTRFFGIPMVEKLLSDGWDVTVATRGQTKDSFGKKIDRIKLDIYNPDSVSSTLYRKEYDVVIDKMGYGASDMKSITNNVSCKKLIHMSTAGVYESFDHFSIAENEFDPEKIAIRYGTRGDFEYHELKRMSEAYLAQNCKDLQWISVRCPYVLGAQDYTLRLFFYVEHVYYRKAMHIDDLDEQICFANAVETGEFIASLANKHVKGPINCCSKGVISIRDIISRIERRVGKKAIISKYGDEAPFNGQKANSLSLEKAESLGFVFSDVYEWIDDLLLFYIWICRNDINIKEAYLQEVYNKYILGDEQ